MIYSVDCSIKFQQDEYTDIQHIRIKNSNCCDVVDLSGPGFNSSGLVRRAGVSGHYRTYHKGPLYASKFHFTSKWCLALKHHNATQPQFAFFEICQCLFFIYLEIWARPRIGMLFHLFPNFKKSCYSHAQSVCICCQMVTAQTVSAADERHNYAFCFLVFRSAADAIEVFLCGASHYSANAL